MNASNVDWVRLILNWFPMLLIFGVWLVLFRQGWWRGGYWGNQRRIADALERIATALEQRR
jgi:hypothetical protein